MSERYKIIQTFICGEAASNIMRYSTGWDLGQIERREKARTSLCKLAHVWTVNADEGCSLAVTIRRELSRHSQGFATQTIRISSRSRRMPAPTQGSRARQIGISVRQAGSRARHRPPQGHTSRSRQLLSLARVNRGFYLHTCSCHP